MDVSRSPTVVSQADVEDALRALYELREVAQNDLPTFAGLVMTDELSGAFVSPVVHQVLMMDFMNHHRKSVFILPINHTKTFSIVAYILWLIARDPTVRVAVFSATEAQAAKIVGLVKSYIEGSEAFKFLSYGKVRPGSTWTSTKLRVKHSKRSKDDTLTAFGIDSKGIAGGRYDHLFGDDLLNESNTQTKDQREALIKTFTQVINSRVEPESVNPRGSVVLTNSAWHPDDLLHSMEKAGWPTMRMQVDGHIYVNDKAGDEYAFNRQYWDHPMVRPAPGAGADPTFGERLRINPAVAGGAHTETSALWPERFNGDWEAQLRRDHPIDIERLRLFYSVCRDDGSAYCKAEWVENCKRNARMLGYHQLGRWTGNPKGTYGGLDIAVSRNEGSDDVAFFIFEVLSTGHRLIVDIDYGKYDGPTIVRKLAAYAKKYGLIVRVENNAAQDLLLQFTREADVSIPIRPHTTGRNKAHPEHGVLSIFVELYNGAWIIPNDKLGRCDPKVQRWIDECLYYRPERHTGDVLMACWFAREQARKFGALPSKTPGAGVNDPNRAGGIKVRPAIRGR
jgi:hypothetical protein